MQRVPILWSSGEHIKDGAFTWGLTQGKRKEEVKGVYTIAGNVLAMEPDTGGTVLAELTMKGSDSVNFKMIGGAADDRGSARLVRCRGVLRKTRAYRKCTDCGTL